MQIKLPPNTRARDLLVKMQTMYLSVALKSDPNNPIVEGTLFERIHPDDSFW